jgi:tripartite-type tricarboxylate transporter receptor subunit TctC
MSMKQLISAAAGAVMTVGFCGAAVCDTVEDFYKDKQVTLLVGYAPGGGYDSFARTLSRHMPAHLPGHPAIVVKNMPGAGSLIVTNFLYNSAPRDGSHFAAVGREMPTAALFGQDNIRFKTDEFIWIGNMESAETFCAAWHTAGFSKAEDLLEKPLIVGGTNGESTTVTIPIAFNNLLGTKLKLIAGYPGGAAMHLALQRGEIQGRCAWSWSSLQTVGEDWLGEGKIKVLLMGTLERSKRFPDVPTAPELAKTPEARQALELLLSQDIIARPYLAPPAVPADRVAALRAAFEQTTTDPAFVVDIKKQRLDLSPMNGAQVERIIKKLYATPKAVVELARTATERTDKTEMKVVQLPTETVKGKIDAVQNEGRSLSYVAGGKKGKIKLSTSGTAVTIAGKKAQRKDLGAGMSCEFTFKGENAQKVACN